MKHLEIATNKLLYSITVAAIALTSCMAEDYIPEKGGTSTGNEINVQISIQLPSPAVRTYAISETDENEITSIDVLTFKQTPVNDENPSGWKFEYRAKGKSITNSTGANIANAKKQFTVTLIKDHENAQKLVVLANVGATLDRIAEQGMAKGCDKDKLLASIVEANGNKWDVTSSDQFTPFPMWGETETAIMINDNPPAAGTIALLRSLARMDVVLNDDVVAEGNFELNEIYVYNRKTKGRVVPDANNLESMAKVKAASEPEGDINQKGPLQYIVPEAMKTAFVRSIYLFEAKGKNENQASQATCVVVGGKYGNDANPTYYRLDFLKKSDSDTYYRDLLRNHSYRLNIISVSGRGYPTPDEAFDAKPINMQAEVVVWDDGQVNDIVFDGQYLLAVNYSTLTVSNKPRIHDKLLVTTDYPKGWTAKVVSGAEWLEIEGTAEGDANNISGLKFKVADNENGSQRTGTIHITAGRLSYAVTITQTNMPEVSLQIIAPTPPQLNFANYNIQPQPIQLAWLPATKACMLTLTPTQNRGLYFATPLPATTPAGGSYTVNVKPDPISEMETTQNPFIVKKSTLNISIEGDEGTSVSRDVEMTQTNYAIVADNRQYYSLNGATYTFKVKSNTAWNMVKTDPDGIITAISPTAGVSDTEQGTTITFKMAKKTTDWGTATLTFHSIDNLCAPVEVVIRGVCGSIIPQEDSGLDYDLLLYHKDQPSKQEWRVFNNVPDGVFDPTDPPLGPQQSPARANSCAALNGYGFEDWRMPTSYELRMVFAYLRGLATNNEGITEYGFKKKTFYYTATQDGHDADRYAITVNTTEYGSNLRPYYYCSTKSTSHYGRCVRTMPRNTP